MPLSYGEVSEDDAQKVIRGWFYKADLDLVVDFIEFSSEYETDFREVCNSFLKREMSAYHFVDGKLVQVNSAEEIIEIETAIKSADKFNSAKTHLKTPLELLSDRKSTDYRNSIKESISAVEALAKIITKNGKATLGQAHKEIEVKHNIPAGLKSTFSSLYGYTSEHGGIRHSLIEFDTNVELEESRFMLIVCSAFINYLINKI